MITINLCLKLSEHSSLYKLISDLISKWIVVSGTFFFFAFSSEIVRPTFLGSWKRKNFHVWITITKDKYLQYNTTGTVKHIKNYVEQFLVKGFWWIKFRNQTTLLITNNQT